MKRNRHKVLNPVPVFLFRGERSARRQLQRRACLSEDAGRKQMPMAAVGVPCSSKNRYPRAGANVRMCECANVRMCECAMAMLASASNQIKSNQIKSNQIKSNQISIEISTLRQTRRLTKQNPTTSPHAPCRAKTSCKPHKHCLPTFQNNLPFLLRLLHKLCCALPPHIAAHRLPRHSRVEPAFAAHYFIRTKRRYCAPCP